MKEEMHRTARVIPRLFSLRLLSFYSIILFAVMLGAGCGSEPQNVESHNSGNSPHPANPAGSPNSAANSGPKPAVPAGAPTVSTSPAAGSPTTADSPTTSLSSSPTPAVIPTTPVGPVGQTTPRGQGGSGQNSQSTANMTFTPAKPAMTPAPEPFPARPTPTVVVKDGKVVQNWQAPEEALSLANPVKNNPDAAKIGREFYLQRCVDCHGKEGKGNGYMSKMLVKPPTNLASKMVQANSDGELFWKITNGKSPMPAHRVRFTDEQRWYIVTYLRTFNP